MTKKCPFCAEEIQSEAIKCRFCGEFFGEMRQVSKERSASKEPSWEYQDFLVRLKADELGSYPKVGRHRPLIITGSPEVQDVDTRDSAAREALWLYLSPTLRQKQEEFAKEGWDLVPGLYTDACLILDLVSPGGCLLTLILVPLTIIPFLGGLIFDALMPKEYYQPIAVKFPMRRARP